MYNLVPSLLIAQPLTVASLALTSNAASWLAVVISHAVLKVYASTSSPAWSAIYAFVPSLLNSNQPAAPRWEDVEI